MRAQHQTRVEPHLRDIEVLARQRQPKVCVVITAGVQGRTHTALGAKVLLSKPHAKPKDQLRPLQPILGITDQEDFNIPHPHRQDRHRPGALGSQQEEEEYAKDPLLAEVKGLLHGADRLLNLVLEIMYRHRAVLPALVRQLELSANLAETLGRSQFTKTASKPW